MAKKAINGERPSGLPRNVRFTREEWALVESWAAELGNQAGVDIKPAEILRKLVREEAARRHVASRANPAEAGA